MSDQKRHGYPLQARVAARAVRYENFMPIYLAVAAVALLVAGQLT